MERAIDEKLLKDCGYHDLSEDETDNALLAISEELSLRVGEKMTEGMSDSQVDEFGAFMDGDVPLMREWLDKNCPDYQSDEVYLYLLKSDPDAEIGDVLSTFGSQKWMEINVPEYPSIVSSIYDEIVYELKNGNPSFDLGVSKKGRNATAHSSGVSMSTKSDLSKKAMDILLRAKKAQYPVAVPDLTKEPILPKKPKEIVWGRKYKEPPQPVLEKPTLFSRKKIEQENQEILAQWEEAKAESKNRYDEEYQEYLRQHQIFEQKLKDYNEKVEEITKAHKLSQKQKQADYKKGLSAWENAKKEDMQALLGIVNTTTTSGPSEIESVLSSLDDKYQDKGELLQAKPCSRCNGKGVCAGKAAEKGESSTTSLSIDELANRPLEIVCPDCWGDGIEGVRGAKVTQDDVKNYFNEPCMVLDQISQVAKQIAEKIPPGDYTFARSKQSIYKIYERNNPRGSGEDLWEYAFILTKNGKFRMKKYKEKKYEKTTETSENINFSSLDDLLVEFDFSIESHLVYTSLVAGTNCGYTYNSYYDSWVRAFCTQEKTTCQHWKGETETYIRNYKKGYGLLDALQQALIALG